MKKYVILILIISFAGIFGWICFIQAGFGVSPPNVSNDRLTPGSHFEKTIYLVRGQPEEELSARVSIDAPEIEDWIKIDKGLKFPLPKGEQKVPMKIIIDVPSDAPLGAYDGYIRVRAVPSIGQEGKVATVLGIRIDINLMVTEKGFSDFKIRGVDIADFERGSPLVVFIILENTGNTKIRPSKVHLDIYDLSHRRLLKSGDILETGWVAPFETKQISGELEIDLELGEYWADISVYKEDESLGIYKIYFVVVPEGTLKKEKVEAEEKGFPYMKIGVIFLTVLIVLAWINRDKIRAFFKKKSRRSKHR